MENKELNNKSASLSPRKESEKRKESKENAVVKAYRVIVQFLRDAKTELKKVKWPTRKELLATTAMVLILVLIVGLFLGLIDSCLMWVIEKLIKIS